MSSFFRYPGGKSKLRNQITCKLNEIASYNNLEYREPFFGGGSIGLLVFEEKPTLQRIWINDFDLGISSLWTALIKYPDLLKLLVEEFQPSVEMFDKSTQSRTNWIVRTDGIWQINRRTC